MNWLILLAALWMMAFPQVGLAQTNETCLACHQAGGSKVRFPDGSEIDVTVDPKRFAASVHASLTCVTCHADQAEYPHRPVKAKTARSYHVLAQQICATCHADQAKVYEASVHGQGLLRGLPDVPTCTSCHTAHAVVRPKTAAFRNNTPETCGNCHADGAVMGRYGLRPIYQAYVEEFHGVTTRLYRLVTPTELSPAAVCYDCHTAHAVRRTADPASPVAPANLLATCRTCHKTAGRFFATAWNEHQAPSMQHSTLVYVVAVFYKILIPSVVCLLVLLTVLDLRYWAVTRWGGRKE